MNRQIQINLSGYLKPSELTLLVEMVHDVFVNEEFPDFSISIGDFAELFTSYEVNTANPLYLMERNSKTCIKYGANFDKNRLYLDILEMSVNEVLKNG